MRTPGAYTNDELMRLTLGALPTRGPVCPKCGACIPQFPPFVLLLASLPWSAARLPLNIRTVRPEELIWRIRMKHNPEQTKKLVASWPR